MDDVHEQVGFLSTEMKVDKGKWLVIIMLPASKSDCIYGGAEKMKSANVTRSTRVDE